MASASSLPSFALQDLCTRAISFPSSITPSERALILARPDPDTENDLHIAATSLPLSALIVKTFTTPPTLSRQEAQILVYGPVQPTHAERAASLQAYDALTSEQRNLLDRASDAVADKEEKKATNVAYRVLQSAKAKEKKKKARERTSPTSTAGTSSSPQGQAPTEAARPQRGQAPTRRRKPIVFPWERTDWIGLISEKNYPSWGLVVLRTAYDDPAAWRTFKSRFDALAARELNRIAPPPVADTFRVKYIDDEDSLAGAEQAGLLAHYARLVREGEVGEGYQWGIFLSVDERVLEIFSAEEREWVVPVWEAGWKAGDVGELGWKGALAMLAGLVFGVLVPMVVRGDVRPLEALAMMAVNR